MTSAKRMMRYGRATGVEVKARRRGHGGVTLRRSNPFLYFSSKLEKYRRVNGLALRPILVNTEIGVRGRTDRVVTSAEDI